MGRLKWFVQVGADEPSVTAYTTDVPGLVAFKSAGGWHLGHLSTHRRVTTHWWRKQDDVQEIARQIGGLFDWGREQIFTTAWENLRDRVLDVENDRLGDPVSYTRCPVRGPESQCLRNDGHEGAHEAYGKRWRDDEFSLSRRA